MFPLSRRTRAVLWDFCRPAALERDAEPGSRVEVAVRVEDGGDAHAVLLSHDLLFASTPPFNAGLRPGVGELARPIFPLPAARPVVRGDVLTVRVEILASDFLVTVL
jgi:hypothetical protein